VESDLFSPLFDERPYRVTLPQVIHAHQHYQVRLFLLDLKWEEYQDWMICPYTYTVAGQYEVWFKDIGKATYFKLSFVL
jgi:hypothetical protein